MDVSVNVPRSPVTVTLELTFSELVNMLTDLDENISYGILDDFKEALKAALD